LTSIPTGAWARSTATSTVIFSSISTIRSRNGLFAEQVRGGGFEGTDYATYWTAIGAPGAVTLVDVPFEKGMKSVRITAAGTPVGLRQRRFYFESGRDYSGSLWVNIEKGTPRLSMRVMAADGSVLATPPITARAPDGRKCHSRFRFRAQIHRA
jgi:hypothetical protein